MKKIQVKICNGTTCFVMGASKFQNFEENIPSKLKNIVEVIAHPCLDLCKNNEYSKAPYVMVNYEVVPEATVEKVLEVIEKNLNQNSLSENNEE